MTTIALTTNAILSHLFNRRGHTQVEDYVRRSKHGEIKLYIHHLVFQELEWILHSYYKHNTDEVVTYLQYCLKLAQANSEKERKVIELALSLYTQALSASITDCFIVAQLYLSNNTDKLLILNKNLQKLYKLAASQQQSSL